MSMKNAMNWWHIVSSSFVGGSNWFRLQFVNVVQYIGSMLSMDEKLYTSAQLEAVCYNKGHIYVADKDM